MARTAKRNDLKAADKAPPPSAPSPPSQSRQPRIVGWLVLIAGGVSTWYWYKPLPDAIHQTVNSTNATSWATSDSGPKSLWSDQGLIVPGTSGFFENPIEFQGSNINSQAAEANLVGAPKVTLVPWSETPHDIREVLKTERLQASAMPAEHKESNSLGDPPRPPLPAASSTLNSIEANISKSSWPDEGYVPPPKAKRRNQVQITAPIPPFLETSMKSIRTTELDDVSRPTQASKTNTESPLDLSSHEPSRQPQFIRQPKREKQSKFQ